MYDETGMFWFNVGVLSVKCCSVGQSEIHRSDCVVVINLAFTCLQVNKVEKFKRSQAKEDALHAKYNLSEWVQVLIFYYFTYNVFHSFSVYLYFHFQQLRLVGSIFETRTATGSELFSLLTCPRTTTFTLLSIFSPLEMSSIKIWKTIRS